ncbi:hypothetical protein ACFL6L_03930 [candidate division KSB1 bacterium]
MSKQGRYPDSAGNNMYSRTDCRVAPLLAKTGGNGKLVTFGDMFFVNNIFNSITATTIFYLIISYYREPVFARIPQSGRRGNLSDVCAMVVK